MMVVKNYQEKKGGVKMKEFNLSKKRVMFHTPYIYIYPEEDVKEFIKILKKIPYNREFYIEQWEEHFKKLNGRKPKRQEIMCFKIGFNAGIELMEQRIEKSAGDKLK